MDGWMDGGQTQPFQLPRDDRRVLKKPPTKNPVKVHTIAKGSLLRAEISLDNCFSHLIIRIPVTDKMGTIGCRRKEGVQEGATLPSSSRQLLARQH